MITAGRAQDYQARDALDVEWGIANARNVEFENNMLWLGLQLMDENHPQFWLSKSMIALNEAGIEMALVVAQPDADMEYMRKAVSIMRQKSDEAREHIAKLQTASLRFTWSFNRTVRDLGGLYRVSVATENEIADNIDAIAGELTDILDGGDFDLSRINSLGVKLQSSVDQRIQEQMARLAFIEEQF